MPTALEQPPIGNSLTYRDRVIYSGFKPNPENKYVILAESIGGGPQMGSAPFKRGEVRGEDEFMRNWSDENKEVRGTLCVVDLERLMLMEDSQGNPCPAIRPAYPAERTQRTVDPTAPVSAGPIQHQLNEVNERLVAAQAQLVKNRQEIDQLRTSGSAYAMAEDPNIQKTLEARASTIQAQDAEIRGLKQLLEEERQRKNPPSQTPKSRS